MAGETPWTPGPWLLDGKLVYALNDEQTANRFSCQMQGGYAFYGFNNSRKTKPDELLANARLIAAAPELAEVTPMLLALVRLKFGNLDPDVNSICEKAEALLSSIRGDAS